MRVVFVLPEEMAEFMCSHARHRQTQQVREPRADELGDGRYEDPQIRPDLTVPPRGGTERRGFFRGRFVQEVNAHRGRSVTSSKAGLDSRPRGNFSQFPAKLGFRHRIHLAANR